jgi:predicted nuclease of predicted toxin-antitoxin system
MTNRYFVSIYLDEDVSPVLAAVLRSRNIVAMSAHEAGRRGATDEEQLAFATEREMAVLTHNRIDFEKLAEAYARAGRRHCGIIIAVRRPVQAIGGRLLKLLDEVSADEMDGQVYYV